MKVLASAYACEPDVGSEPGIGWRWAREIAMRHELWLVTRENNVAAIERRAREEDLRDLHVVGYDLPPWARFWKRGGRGAMPYFYLWQLGLARVARKLDARVDFDVLHHLTFASSWIQSGLAAVDKPFVWGPVGQHPRVPDRFLLPSDVRLRLAEPLKAAVRVTLSALDPLLARTRRRADLVLSLSDIFGARAPASVRGKLVPMLACGVDAAPCPHERRGDHGALRVLYAGRLVDLKGVRLALEAFALLRREVPDARFDCVGAGPRAGWLATRARALGVADAVHLHGQLPLTETLAHMRAADVFLFPSFEGGGMVVPEAMNAGCALVCLDHGGPGEMAREGRGVAVPVQPRFDATATALTGALVALARDATERVRLAQRARAWAGEAATWTAKGEKLDELYEAAIANHHGLSAHHALRSAG
ncbi:MAG: glycosyltransferase family 4 protein [bacterium]|nr:glycosyltransferase family 4 protein [bacterium]